ncbi:MAG TPA: lysylphosphatidylglycerol synthase transmembrane domain-containing protein [Cellvibrio sp.]|nr:lysylphosphatidylglycerol synthase transmembrane domain-containing protein [Cellvibrio sp.]
MTKAKIFVGLLWISALLLASWTLTQLPLASIITSLNNISALEYLVWSSANLAIIFIFTFRWWLLSKAIEATTSFWQLLIIRQAGQSISFITPGPQFGGEPLQLYWLWKHTKIALHKALLALGFDRFFELWVNFAVLIGSVLLVMMLSENSAVDWLKIVSILCGILLLLSLAGMTLLKKPQWISTRLSKITHRWQSHRYLASIKTQWNLLTDDLIYCVKDKKRWLGVAFLLSILGWFGMFIELEILLWMADIKVDLSGFLLFFIALRLALLLPLPGGIGTIEAAVFWVFQYLNLGMESALVIIALIRLRDIAMLSFGLITAIFLQITQKEPDDPITSKSTQIAN